MTMDMQKNVKTLEDQKASPNIECAKSSQVLKSAMESNVLKTTKPSKRSFDVAFLMMPDERIRPKFNEKQLRISKQLFNNEEWDPSFKSAMRNHKNKETPEDCVEVSQEVERSYYDERIRANNNISPNLGSDINIDVGTDEYPSKVSYCSDSDNSDISRSRPNSNESATRPKFESPYKNKIFDDPALISTQTKARYENRYLDKQPDNMSPKSAFTKVSNFAIRSPNPSMSPDSVIYQDSVSPPLSGLSPPTLNKASGFSNLLSSAHLLNGNSFFRNQMPTPSSSSSFVENARPGPYRSDFHPDKQAEPKMHHNASKMNFMPFRTDMPPYLPGGSSYPFAVQNFQSPNSDFMKMSQREPSNPMIVNPAAAILSTLLPPTLAAFSLPAQNVCAKCNISFRMTSDLVYHMRTHHKSESIADPHRRKREEKLKCSVCNESFRERHHLTRHMTAHQDKEGDNETPQSYNKKNKQYFAQNMTTTLHK